MVARPPEDWIRLPEGVVPRLLPSSQSGDPMADLPEPEPVAATEPPRIDLFMTVIRVASWKTTVRWYIDTLGLTPILLDSQHEFALLSAGSGHTTLTDSCSRHTRVQSQGRPWKLVELEPHPLKARPARTCVPTRAPYPGAPDRRAGAGRVSAAIVMPGNW